MKRNKIVDITSFNLCAGNTNTKFGSTVTTHAVATLAIHKDLIEKKHFVVAMASFVPEDGDYKMVKVYAKTRVKGGAVVDHFLEFPTALVSTKIGFVPEDMVGLLQEMVNEEDGHVREDKASDLLDILEKVKVGVVRKDTAFPITKEFRHHCTQIVFDEIERVKRASVAASVVRTGNGATRDRRVRYLRSA